MLIYKATSPSGKSYIGQTIKTLNERKVDHIYCAMNKRERGIFHFALKKYKPENFTWEILEDNIQDLKTLNEREIYWISYYKTLVPNGYNLTGGGDGHIITKVTKIKMSRSARNKPPMTEETKKKISKNSVGMTDKHHTIESRKLMSQKAKGKTPWMKGKQHTEEAKIKCGLKNKHPLEQEHREKISATMQGVPKPESMKAKLRKPRSEATKLKIKLSWILRKEKSKSFT